MFHILESSYFTKCSLTTDETKRVLHIYGVDIETLQGKTTKRNPIPISNIVATTSPIILELHLTINLLVDYFVV